MRNFQKERLIERSKKLKNQIVEDCEFCNGKGIDGCKCIKRSNLLIELAYANVPWEYWFLSLKGFKSSKVSKDKVKKYCAKIKKAKKLGLGLCFYGKFGRGKTFLATHILKKATIANFSIYFVTLAELLTDIRNSFGFDGEELSDIQLEFDKNYVQSDFLVLDNLDREYRRDNSNFVPIIFDEILRKRKSNGNVTILTTNSNPKKLKDSYGSAVFSILQSSVKSMQIRGEDYRQGKADNLWVNL